MGKRSRTKDALCPFYHNENETIVTCDGIVEGSVVMNRFASRKLKEEHADDFCYGNYKGCPVYQTIDENWRGG